MAAALSAEFGRRKSDPAAFTEEQLSAGAYDKMAVGGIAGRRQFMTPFWQRWQTEDMEN